MGLVFRQVGDFKNWKSWDPLYAQDSLQKRVYRGTMGDRDYSFNWASKNKNVGNGRLTMKQLSLNKEIEYELRQSEQNGVGSSSSGKFTFNTTNEKVDVQWELVSELSYPYCLKNLVWPSLAEREMERALDRLKIHTESRVDTYEEVISNVELINEFGARYAVIQAEGLAADKVESFLAESFPKLYTHVETNGLSLFGPARAFYYDWDKQESRVTIAAAVPISDISEGVGISLFLGSNKVKVTSKSIECVVSGGAEQTYDVHNRLDEWINSKGRLILRPIIEEYKVGPIQSADTSTYQTRIIYYFE